MDLSDVGEVAASALHVDVDRATALEAMNGKVVRLVLWAQSLTLLATARKLWHFG